MNEIYYITPLFKFDFRDEQNIPRIFEHTYISGNIEYNISLKEAPCLDILPIPLQQKFDQRTWDLLKEICRTSEFGQTCCADYCLIITAKSQSIINYEANYINAALLDTFRLYATNGILYDSTLRIYNKDDIIETQKYSAVIKDSGMVLDGDSYLLTDEFDNCKDTFEILVRKEYKNNKVFDKLLKIAINYHRIVFQLSYTPAQFLLLMIIFETLFKKNEDTKINDSAEILAKIIEKNKNKQVKIVTDFYKKKKKKNRKKTKDTYSFSGLRNMIAHGDPSLSDKRVMVRYQLLYEYIRKAIIAVLHITDEEIGKNDYYYDKIKIIASNK